MRLAFSRERSRPHAAHKGFSRPVPPMRINARGRFQGYASLFGVMDLGRDIVLPGAFRDSLARRGASGIKQLWQHDPSQPTGIWVEIREDQKGLFVKGALNLAVPRAQHLHSLISHGALDGLSIGYRTQIDRRDPATGARWLEKIDLWEISLVTFPLLPQARIAALSEESTASIESIL